MEAKLPHQFVESFNLQRFPIQGNVCLLIGAPTCSVLLLSNLKSQRKLPIGKVLAKAGIGAGTQAKMDDLDQQRFADSIVGATVILSMRLIFPRANDERNARPIELDGLKAGVIRCKLD